MHGKMIVSRALSPNQIDKVLDVCADFNKKKLNAF